MQERIRQAEEKRRADIERRRKEAEVEVHAAETRDADEAARARARFEQEMHELEEKNGEEQRKHQERLDKQLAARRERRRKQLQAKQQKEREDAEERAKEAEEAAKAEAAHKREMRALQKAQAARAAAAQSALASDTKAAELSGETVEAVMQQRHGRETSTLLAKQYADRTRKLRRLLESHEEELQLRLDDELSGLEEEGATPEEIEARKAAITEEHHSQRLEAEAQLREQLEAKHARQQLSLRQRQLAEIAGALQKLTPHETLRRREAEEAAKEADELRRFEEEMEQEKTSRLENIRKEKEELEHKIREENERALKQLEEDHERQLAEERRRAEEALARRKQAMQLEQDAARKEAMEKAQHLDQKERDRLLQQLEAERQQLEAKFEEQRRAHDERLRSRLERRAQRRREAAARKMQDELAKRQAKLQRQEEDLKARSHALHGVMSKRGSAALGSMAPVRAGTRAGLLRGRTGALGRGPVFGGAAPGRRLTIGAKGAPSTEDLRSQLQGLKAAGSAGRAVGLSGMLGRSLKQSDADSNQGLAALGGFGEEAASGGGHPASGSGAGESKASEDHGDLDGLGDPIEEDGAAEGKGIGKSGDGDGDENESDEELTLDSDLGAAAQYGAADQSSARAAAPGPPSAGGRPVHVSAQMDDRTKSALKQRLDRIEDLIRKVQQAPARGPSAASTSAPPEGKEDETASSASAAASAPSRPLALLLPPAAPRGFVTTSSRGDSAEELPSKDGDGAQLVLLENRDAEIAELGPREVVRLRFARRMAALLQGAPLEDDLSGSKSMKLGLIRRVLVAKSFPAPADPRTAAPGNDFLWVPAGMSAANGVELQAGSMVVRAAALEGAGELLMSLCVAMACAQTVRGGGEGAPSMLKASTMPRTAERARNMLQSCLKLCFSSDTASGSDDVNALLMQHGAAAVTAGGMGRRRSSAMALQQAAGGHLPSDDEDDGSGAGTRPQPLGGAVSPRGAAGASPGGLLRRPESFERNLRRYTSFAQAVLTSRRMPSFSLGSVANLLEARHKAGLDPEDGEAASGSQPPKPLDIGGLVDQEVDESGAATSAARGAVTGLSTVEEVSEPSATPEASGRRMLG